MAVVNREQHQVFIVPAEGGILHTYVEPGNIYATNVLLSWKLHQTVERAGQIIQIPGMILIRSLVRVNDLLAFSSEAGAELRGRDVSCILNLHKGFHLLVDHSPVVLFDFTIQI